jgi:hypothetical protein
MIRKEFSQMPTYPPSFFFFFFFFFFFILKSSGRNDCRLRRVKAATCKDSGKQNAVQLTLNENAEV